MNNFLRSSFWAPFLITSIGHCCEAFLRPSSIIIQSKAALERPTRRSCSSRLHGIQEWREQALESKYTLDSFVQSNAPSRQLAGAPAELPILPFPFGDILLQGQRKQLNLYEQRFHELFQDALDNHCGMVGMGLLAGNGMITTLPLCEVESFTRFGADETWAEGGNQMGAMGNGCIIVTIRAVGRVKIVESDLLQEEPYMKAHVAEILDEDANMSSGSGMKEKVRGVGTVRGESTPLEVASLVAGNVENLLLSLASMEHRFKEAEERKRKSKDEEAMNRRLVNAQLESLFMNDSVEGVDFGSSEDGAVGDDGGEEEEEDEFSEEEKDDDALDRVAQFERAFEDANESDTFGYVLQPSNAVDNLSQRTTRSSAVRSPKDLTAISWAAFCTGDRNDLQRDVMKIQALDTTNVMQRLQLAAAMLREEKKKWTAKLALAEMKDAGKEE